MPNPWFAAVLGFTFQPLAFVYLSRWIWVATYLVALLLVGCGAFFFPPHIVVEVLGLALPFVAAIHAYRLARNTQFESGRKWFNYWWGALAILSGLVVSLLSVRTFFYEPFQIPGSAMEPNLSPGDHVVVSKWGYGNYELFEIPIYQAPLESRRRPRAGELFVFYPPHQRVYYIKRIIGVPGDTVSFSDNQLTINGVAVPTSELGGEVVREELGKESYEVLYLPIQRRVPEFTFSVTVPEDSYFVMGDNRNRSLDSRMYGTVAAEDIIGKVVADF